MDGRIKRVLLYVEQHIVKDFDLANLARIAGISEFHFHRLFKSVMGETPKAYVNRVRMEHIAHMMVVRNDKNITDIAFDYGFSSPAAFTRAFKAIYQVTPRSFRAKMREKHQERLQNYWADLEEGESFVPKKLELRYFPLKRFCVTRTRMVEKTLNDVYRQMIAENFGRVSHGVTIYTEAPFRSDRDTVRLYVGLDENVETYKHGRTIEVQGGYYYSMQISGDFEAMISTMYKTFQRDIEPSPYRVASTTFYERVKLPLTPKEFDYFSCERTIFGRLERHR